VRNYKTLLTGTSRNCNGGRTPRNTWISCEEVTGGQCWPLDQQGLRAPQTTVLGGTAGGSFEAFAYDVQNPAAPSCVGTDLQPTLRWIGICFIEVVVLLITWSSYQTINSFGPLLCQLGVHQLRPTFNARKVSLYTTNIFILCPKVIFHCFSWIWIY
jgi:Bacterial protein of unknown function (DUF839)